MRGDHEFLDRCLELGHLSAAEAKSVRESFDARKKAGTYAEVERILLQKGCMTPEQIMGVQDLLKRRIVVCSCGKKLNIYKFEEGRTGHCPRCQESVVVPAVEEYLDGLRAALPDAGASERASEDSDDMAAGEPDPVAGAGEGTEGTIELDRYVLTRKLGEGAMGTVYLGCLEVLGKPVAVKLIKQSFRDNEEYVARFRREARLAGGLSHPNLVQVFDFIDRPEALAYVMEYVEGTDLKERVQSGGGVDLAFAVRVFRQVASGLSALHRAGIIHRDIKPQNVMMLEGDMAKLTDFGLAKNTAESCASLTESNRTMGTPAFMPPEQAEDAASATRLSDIYSLGASLYYCLCLVPPFRGRIYEVLSKVCRDEPRPISSFRSDLPADFVAGVEKMMSKRPEDRFPDTASVLDFLNAFSP